MWELIPPSTKTDNQLSSYRTLVGRTTSRCMFSITKTKKNMAPVRWQTICNKNLPRYVLLIWEGNARRSMEASNMAKRNGWWWKMIRKMFSKHQWSSSFVYTWKDIDLFVAFWIIIRHLGLRGCGNTRRKRSPVNSVPTDSVSQRLCPCFKRGTYRGRSLNERESLRKIV